MHRAACMQSSANLVIHGHSVDLLFSEYLVELPTILDSFSSNSQYHKHSYRGGREISG